MNHRPWVSAPLAGAAIALASPPAGAAALAPLRHTPASLRVRDGDGGHDHRNPWRDCHSHRRVVLISPTLRAFLTNGRRGPEALVLQGTPKSTPWSPEQPLGSFTVAKYLNVNYPSTTTAQYAFAIKDFFRVHPLFLVNTYGNHKRAFPFPEAHCNDHNDNDGEDRDRPQGGSPSTTPRKDAPAPRDDTAAGWSTGLLSTQHILIAAGGLLMLLGMLATTRRRRRRSNE
ncbi:hypothetical protein ABZX95_48875 [Streptomyces sp. NPDC004232]|uniref:hypothetical protein n=1 Tax=Streptomyces sp. NPDC004232 TaxID=3154454 RepID=UPI0033BEEE57